MHGAIRTFALGVVWASLACSSPKWRGFVYPTGSAIGGTRDLGEYGSLEQCRAAALTYLRDLNTASRGDYECGSNCRPAGVVVDIITYTCDETLK